MAALEYMFQFPIFCPLNVWKGQDNLKCTEFRFYEVLWLWFALHSRLWKAVVIDQMSYALCSYRHCFHDEVTLVFVQQFIDSNGLSAEP